MRVEGLQVGVQVDALVGRVGEPVQALAGAGVGAVGDDLQLVAAARPASAIRSPSKAAGSTGLPFRVISLTAGAVRSMKVDAPGLAQPKRDGGRRPERGRAAGEVELDPVGLDLEQPCPLPRLVRASGCSPRC